MKRAPLVLGATAAGLAAVLSFHTRSVPAVIGSISSSAKGSSASSAAAAPPRGKSTSSKSTPSTTSPPSSSTTTPSSSSNSAATRSATGSLVNYSYGDLSVKVTVSGTRITNVQIASLDDGGNFRSQSIDEYSIPILEQEAISAQSANIQGVSGATFTSSGFQQSLQSALSELGLS